MLRLGAIFVAVCMVLIAGSLGAVLYLAAGMTGLESTLAALTALTGMALYNTVTTRLRDRTDLGAQIADLSRGTSDLARQVAEIGRRLAAIESQGDVAADRARAATEPLAAEIGELGTLVKQIADSVASHDAKLVEMVGRTATPATVAEAAGAAGLGDPDGKNGGASGEAIGRLAAAGQDAALTAIRAAVEANRIDLYLQPIVTLPQRKVRYYEALTRLRTEDGQTLTPSEFLAPAESAGLLPQIDNTLLFRSVQVVRRLLLKNRDIGLFCNIALSTLNDPKLFAQMSEFMNANRALAPSLVLEFRQDIWRAMGPLELESLSALRDLGFRFCMDRVSDLRIEPRDLAERGIRFVKVPAAVLLSNIQAPSSDIHPSDLSDLLARYGISLIADRIEAESQVVDLLDYELKFGQGFLFSPPRPVRAEALQSADTDAAVGGASRDARTAAAGA